MVKPNRGRGRGGASRGGYYTSQAPTKKRVRVPSDEQDDVDGEVEVNPELLVDSLLACLTKKESLLDRFVSHLLKIPALQNKIAQLVMGSFDPNCI